MRYKVYSDNYLIMDSMQDELLLPDAKVDLEINKLGSFSFMIYPNNPHYDKLQKLKSMIKVFQDDDLIFRGRILDDEIGWYKQKQVLCEGELAFLLDTIQRPYDFLSGENHTTIKDLFTFYINNHNRDTKDPEHRFIVGEVTVTDSNDYIVVADSSYLNTWESISQKLIDRFGGYIRVRHETDGVYIDYLKDFDTLGSQSIEFGKNLLDISLKLHGEDVYTAIIPIGAVVNEETDEKLTITELVDDDTSSDFRKENDYIYNVEAVEKYGLIFKIEEWEDVTTASELFTKAKAKLTEDMKFDAEIELTAADLAANNTSIKSFKLGNYVSINSKYHGLNDKYLVQKLSIVLLKPSENAIIVGKSYKSFTEQALNNANKSENNVKEIYNGVKKVETNVNKINGDVQNISNNISEQISSEILKNADSIISVVSEDYVSKGEFAEVVQSTNTRFEQTNDEFAFRFNEFSKDLTNTQNGNEAKFSEISKYIRFIDGNIVLGETNNLITLKIQNDRISFLENDVEVAYFQNRKLYVNDGEFLGTLKIGAFEFIKRANGNVSFKKVVS